jgi:hypothetical protein
MGFSVLGRELIQQRKPIAFRGCGKFFGPVLLNGLPGQPQDDDRDGIGRSLGSANGLRAHDPAIKRLEFALRQLTAFRDIASAFQAGP